MMEIQMKITKILLFCTTVSMTCLGFPAVAANLAVKEGTYTMKEVPRNAVDTVKGFFERTEEKYVYETKNRLILEDIETQDSDDGSTKINLKIYSPFTMDSFIQVYNSENKISEIKIIEGRSVPEDLLSGAYEIVTKVPSDALKYNILDSRNNYKQTDVQLEVETGSRIDFSTSSSNVLVYNLILSGLGVADFGAGLPNTSETKKLVASFVKELYAKGEIDLLALNLTNDSRISNNLLESPTFAKLLDKFGEFLKVGLNSAQPVVVSKLSDGVESLVAKLGVPGALVAGASKVTFGIVKVTNFTLRAKQAIEMYSRKDLVFSLSVGADKNTPDDWKLWLPESGSAADRQNQSVQDYSSCITQYSSSHIGSASCYISRNSSQSASYEQQRSAANAQPGSIQENNQYTSGQIVRAPLDIGLTWNQDTKLDLDSHLATPNGEHIYFSERGKLNGTPSAFLYRDSIPNGGLKGAEQTRITQFQDGQYRFYVYNYSEADGQESARIAGPNGLSNSGATVKLYEGGAPLTDIPNDPAVFNLNDPNVQKVGNPYPGNSTFNVPTNQPGNTWYVFKLDTRTGILTRVDRFGNSPKSGTVPNVR
jgi:hypothetical protein